MSLLRRLLDLMPHDTLVIGGEPYMHRWYMGGYAPGEPDPSGERAMASRPGWWWNWPFGAGRLHCTVASDDSRAFHDHPWDFVSIGLRGAYIEERPRQVNHFEFMAEDVISCSAPSELNPVRRFKAPFINRKRATDLHLLRVVDGPVWTLFMSGRKVRTWGFAGPNGWTAWRDFIDSGETT